MKEITVKEFFESKRESFALSLISHQVSLENVIKEPYINRPGLALAGFTEKFSYDRIQILGETEISYLQTLKKDDLYYRVNDVFHYNIPCVIVAKGLSLPAVMVYIANNLKIAILSSRLSTDRLVFSISQFLRETFAAETILNGTLLDVFGVGVLITGKSGVGKSESALDLIERGHRFVTDDRVRIYELDSELFGMHPNYADKNNNEYITAIRGIGRIDVEKLFGIERIRDKKRIDLLVELINWKSVTEQDLTGQTENFANILGVNVPVVYLPVAPGKNVAMLIEVIAMNYIAKLSQAGETTKGRYSQKGESKKVLRDILETGVVSD